MSSLIVDDTGNSAVVDADSDVRQLQHLVRKLQVQKKLLDQADEKPTTDSENSPYVVDSNCNSDVFQCTPLPRTSVLHHEQQLNSNNSRLISVNSVENVRGAASQSQLTHSPTNGSDELPMNAKVPSDDLSLDSVQLIDVDGKLSGDEESWLASFIGNRMIR